MRISRAMLKKAVEAKIITDRQAQRLLEFIKQLPEQELEFNLTNVLYYLGGLIAIGAMTVFMNLGWSLYGGGGILILALLYGLLAVSLAKRFQNKNQAVPAGICATFAISMTPLAIFGLQQMMGWWPTDTNYADYYHLTRGKWFYMELATLVVGIIMLLFYRYPYMLMPIAISLWFMSMDLANKLSDVEGYHFLNSKISMYFGLITLLIAFWVDVKALHKRDYAFWLYLFGAFSFWLGLTFQYWDSEFHKFLYMGINVVMILLGVILTRKVLVVFGSCGLCFYLSYLAFRVFEYSYLFPVALTAIGGGIIYLGLWWQKNEATLTSKLRSFLPAPLRELLVARQGD